MQITIKDTMIKQMLTIVVEDCLGKRNSKMVNEIFADPKFQKRMAKELSALFNEEGDVVRDILEEIDIPQLDKAVQESV